MALGQMGPSEEITRIAEEMVELLKNTPRLTIFEIAEKLKCDVDSYNFNEAMIKVRRQHYLKIVAVYELGDAESAEPKQ